MRRVLKMFFMLMMPVVLFGANAIVQDFSGDVGYLKAGTGEKIPVTKSLILTQEDVIITGKDGMVKLLLDTGSQITIGNLTRVKIAKLTDVDTLLELTLGELKAKVKKLKGDMSFKVRTPASVCAVRGTEFVVKVDETGKTKITVFAGIVSAREISGIGEEVYIRQNQFLEVIPGVEPSAPVDISAIYEAPAEVIAMTKAELLNEVKGDLTKEEVQQAAAIEIKNAEYEQGKTMIDYFGKRVRIEEYIVRPYNPVTKQYDQFKFVALNERDDRFDYFTWLATFNTELPTDLSVANKIAFEKEGNEVWTSEPAYWVKEHDCLVSNTVDKVTWKKTRENYDKTEKLTEWKVNDSVIIGTGKQVTKTEIIPSSVSNKYDIVKTLEDGSSFTVTVDKTSSYAYDKYTANSSDIDFNGYQEEYYFIDDEGDLVSRNEYNSNTLAYNEEFVITADNFSGHDKKIDLVVEPEIFKQAGIR